MLAKREKFCVCLSDTLLPLDPSFGDGGFSCFRIEHLFQHTFKSFCQIVPDDALKLPQMISVLVTKLTKMAKKVAITM